MAAVISLQDLPSGQNAPKVILQPERKLENYIPTRKSSIFPNTFLPGLGKTVLGPISLKALCTGHLNLKLSNHQSRQRKK